MSISPPNPEHDALLEYSVVFTDRALNHMSEAFQGVMRDISRVLKTVYHADTVAVIPGSGTFGMEAVARQFATNKKCLVIRNGWFSYRWSQIFEMGSIPADAKVLSASTTHTGPQAPFAPPPIEEVVAAIREYQPDLVFAPHVETASGILLPDEYLAKLAAAVHEVGGLFVLDCIASGTIWVDMQCLGIDVVISAPQKGWTGSACCALVMLSARAAERLSTTRSTSFACDLAKWVQIMHSYEEGGHAYHATLPTDSLVVLRDAMLETERYGFEQAKTDQYALGQAVRDLLAEKGFNSVAAPGFQAPGVVVSYTEDSGLQSAEKFADVGVQAAAGVPLKCDEPPSFKTFRLGLFGLDKLQHRERTVAYLKDALDQLR